VGDESGCAGDNPTCNMTQLLADNAINSVYPQFADVAGGGWDVVNADDLPQPVAIPAFPAWGAFTPPVPAGAISPVVPADMRGQLRRGHDTVGAVVTSEVPTTPAARVFVPCLWK
jgi:hypothetical protein